MTNLEQICLGQTNYCISRLGMGCWAIGGHGWGKVHDSDSERAIKCALDNGVTFFDTADTYGFGKSEILLSNTLGHHRHNMIIATKGGVRWNDRGKIWKDNSPAYLRIAVENSLRRLKLEFIPLYYIHKPEEMIPVQESIAALARMREEGKIGGIGVANFSAEQLLCALNVAKIDAIQLRFNIFDVAACQEIISICKNNSLTIVAWGALADGLLTGKFKKCPYFSDDDHRSKMKEFKEGNFLEYIRCVESLEQLAFSLKHKVSHLALRWILDFAPFTCALFGAKTDKQVQENLGANGWKLSGETLKIIDSIIMEHWR